MIKEVKMYVVVCDNCHKECDDDDHSLIAWGDEVQARVVADDAGWWREGDKNYCPECYGFDDDGKLMVIQNVEGK